MYVGHKIGALDLGQVHVHGLIMRFTAQSTRLGPRPPTRKGHLDLDLP